jgi:1-acyl-sn-glycerol-3-phosphate acyltransferase
MILKYISKFSLWIWGFKVRGSVQNELSKKLFVIIPHTSNWDGPLGIFVKLACDMQLNFLAKDSLFKGPLGWIVRGLGGVPVNRSKNNRLVDYCVELYETRDNFGLVITPEATRSRVTKLRKGFYNIAHKAEVPLVLVGFDYRSKEVRFRKPFYTSGDYYSDMRILLPWFDGVVGKHEELNSLPFLTDLNLKTDHEG